MSYTLQGIISKHPPYNWLKEKGLNAVSLEKELFLIPLTYDYVEKNGIPFLPLTDCGETDLNVNLVELCSQVSVSGKCIYVEAEFFGGEGTQACALFENSNLVEPCKEDLNAINYALSWLGVTGTEHVEDKFAAIGLGQHRNTEEWLNA